MSSVSTFKRVKRVSIRKDATTPRWLVHAMQKHKRFDEDPASPRTKKRLTRMISHTERKENKEKEELVEKLNW